jgi:hypothetical protein
MKGVTHGQAANLSPEKKKRIFEASVFFGILVLDRNL